MKHNGVVGGYEKERVKGGATFDAVKVVRSIGGKTKEGQEGKIEITFMRVNGGDGGDHDRDAGTNNSNNKLSQQN